MLPSILNDGTTFWLDFGGSRLPETSKSEEKLRLEISVFFSTEENVEDRFFQISGSILTSVLEPGAAKKCDIRYYIFVFFSGGVFFSIRGRFLFPRKPFLASGSLFLSKIMCFTMGFFKI